MKKTIFIGDKTLVLTQNLNESVKIEIIDSINASNTEIVLDSSHLEEVLSFLTQIIFNSGDKANSDDIMAFYFNKVFHFIPSTYENKFHINYYEGQAKEPSKEKAEVFIGLPQ